MPRGEDIGGANLRGLATYEVRCVAEPLELNLFSASRDIVGEEAAAHLDDALDLHRAANDRTGQARAHAELADLARVRGDEAAARRHGTTAASLLGRGEDT
ncbi:hypothetical protein [Streptomyces sp. NPDC094466]|uniref:hypothetical protein n=1 Tax=Streptomyces sp. NPDC094466 TaxID=3366065 RepID=UPI00381D4C4A